MLHVIKVQTCALLHFELLIYGFDVNCGLLKQVGRQVSGKFLALFFVSFFLSFLKEII